MSSVWFRDFQDKTCATYWFMPLLMSLLGAILAVVVYWISQLLPSSLLQYSGYLMPSMTIAEAAKCTDHNSRDHYRRHRRRLLDNTGSADYRLISVWFNHNALFHAQPRHSTYSWLIRRSYFLQLDPHDDSATQYNCPVARTGAGVGGIRYASP